MKKFTMAVMALIGMFALSGCNGGYQPIPTASGGQSKSSFMSGIETELMTGKFTLFSVGATNITAKDGAIITFVPNPPTLRNQPKTF